MIRFYGRMEIGREKLVGIISVTKKEKEKMFFNRN